MANFSLLMLGAGAGCGQSLCSSAVVERNGEPLLMIDCGPGALHAYRQQYQQLPRHLFITHTHLDHIADLERLFIAARFETDHIPRIYLPAALVESLCRRLDHHPSQLAEGGCNIWEELQLVPVFDGFWLDGCNFHVYPARHHRINFSFSLSLPGRFFYTGDTKPIPEVLHHHAAHGEVILHDCSLLTNPSHSGVQELAESYEPSLLSRIRLYHYANEQEAKQLEREGFKVVRGGERIELTRGLKTAVLQ